MAGTSFCLVSALAQLYEKAADGHQELGDEHERTLGQVESVLSNLKAAANSGQCEFAVPKTPGRKLKARISAKKSFSSQAASVRKTRSVSKGSKKQSSTKKKTLAVQDDAKSSTSSEDPEKENADVQPKSAVRATRAASKKGPPAVKIDDATPKENSSLRQPLRSTRQTRAQAKAQTANLVAATPPRGAGTSRALLFSPANRATTPSKQLFSPYAKCSVQEKARAFESKEPITPLRPAATPKSSNAARNQTTTAAVTKEVVRCTPLLSTPMHPPSELVTEDRVPATLASPKTPALPSPVKSASENSSIEETAAATLEAIAPTSQPLHPPSAPDTELVKERRITRASVAAASVAALPKTTAQATPAGIRAASRPCPVSSSSTAESDSDDDWVESPTTPKRARLLPTSSHVGSGVKFSGVLGSGKTVRKDWPGHKASVGRKISSTSTSSFRSAPMTPKQVTPSKVARPFTTSEARQGAHKASILEESTRKRHDSSSSELEQQRKQELLRMKMEATKKEREQRLARVQAQRERREAERREQEQLRQREAQQKELERLKQRTAFHQRKQSERSLNVDTLAAATKRKAESPLVSAAKRLTPLKISKPPKMARNACADAEAARLIFAQPSTSLSQKAKLNNSLQQQAMLNSLSQSLRSQASFLPSPERPQAASAASQSITELVESTPEKPSAALNATMTLSSKDKPAEALGETFTVPSTDHDSSVLKTPSAANSTFVRTEGPPRSSGYDITPHRSELPPEPNKNKDNYDIEDLNSGDETDDDEKPRKEVPAWAKGAALNALVARQNRSGISGLEFFGQMPLLSLDSIFPVKKKTFNKRTSSALWD
uniref:Putative inner centromere protein b n=1 Tax=Rhipicephalus pulchellus TaxID=72859 RepID=L7LVS5_RHIPC